MAIFDSSLDVTGVLGFNERDVAVIQARTAGFVERVYAHAPGDVLKANAALADILVPEWAAAQTEFLALKRNGDADLLACGPPTTAAHRDAGSTDYPCRAWR